MGFNSTKNPSCYIGVIIQCQYPGCDRTFRKNSAIHKFCSEHSRNNFYGVYVPRNWNEIEKKIQKEHLKILNTKVYKAVEIGGNYTQSELMDLVKECRR